MKKLLLTLALCALMCALFIVGVSGAEAVTDDGTDTYTLGDCTIAGLDGVTIPSPTRGLAYSLDSETMTATVTGKGSFVGGEGVSLVFPSSVTYGGNTYTVTTINSGTFQKMTYDLYVPDSITKIGGGSTVGAFGGSVISKVYIGNGLKEFEQEIFSGSKGYTVFICKSKVESVGVYAFNINQPASTGLAEFELDLTHAKRIENNAFNGATFLQGQSIELGEKLEYVGKEAFMSSKVSGKIVIPEGCTLSYRSFNGTSFERVVIKVAKGETKQLPQELFSGASASLTVVISGEAIAVGSYLFSANSMSVYMPTKAQLQTLVSSVASYSDGADRMEKVTFYCCEEQKSYTATRAGVMSDGAEATVHAYTDNTLTLSANCTYFEREAYVCYACGNEDIVSQGTELGAHVFETSTKAPNCQSIGYTEYDCTVCDFQCSGAFIEKSSHSNTVKKYTLNNNKTVTVESSCEYCGTVASTENVSLVNKCYIDGYGLFKRRSKGARPSDYLVCCCRS